MRKGQIIRRELGIEHNITFDEFVEKLKKYRIEVVPISKADKSRLQKDIDIIRLGGQPNLYRLEYKDFLNKKDLNYRLSVKIGKIVATRSKKEYEDYQLEIREIAEDIVIGDSEIESILKKTVEGNIVSIENLQEISDYFNIPKRIIKGKITNIGGYEFSC